MEDKRLYLEAVYRELTDVSAGHDVTLVQNNLTGKIYVKKELSRYSMEVFQTLHSHPIANVPQIIEMVELDGKLVVIEEYIAGSTLQDILDENGCLDEDTVVSYMTQLCAILEQLHHLEPAVIHRDLKPANVMLSQDGVIKLLDLDAAKLYHEAQEDSTLLGTAGYAAPEQYGICPSGVQSDLYAVGVMMNVLLCGEHPAVRMADGYLLPVIRKCLEINVNDRYQSAGELAEDMLSVREAAHQKKEHRGWRAFLPPGFRSGRIPVMIAAALGYLMVLWLGATIEVVDAASVFDVMLNRVFFTCAILGMILFSGNYLAVQDTLPFLRGRNMVVRAVLVAAMDAVILVMAVCVLSILEGILFGM